MYVCSLSAEAGILLKAGTCFPVSSVMIVLDCGVATSVAGACVRSGLQALLLCGCIGPTRGGFLSPAAQ